VPLASARYELILRGRLGMSIEELDAAIAGG
jgi:hypothetical protein